MKVGKKRPIQKRQGDVFIEEIETLPDNLKPVPKDRGATVLAYGEVTGHSHKIREGAVALLEAENGARYMKATQEALLQHEEHRAAPIEAVNWEVIQQVQFTPESILPVGD